MHLIGLQEQCIMSKKKYIVIYSSGSQSALKIIQECRNICFHIFLLIVCCCFFSYNKKIGNIYIN